MEAWEYCDIAADPRVVFDNQRLRFCLVIITCRRSDKTIRKNSN